MADFNFTKPKTETIKENARPKPRVFAKFVSNIRGKGLQVAVAGRKISVEELNAVKTKIRKKIAKNNQRRLIFRLTIIIMLLIPAYFLGQKFFKSVEAGQQALEKQHERAFKKRKEYITKGYKQLNMNDFYKARWFFKKAAAIDSNDYLLQLGFARTYINLCKYHNVDCAEAARSIQLLKTEYGDQPEIQEVTNEFIEIQD